ncbi:MAG: hypothetical protein R3F28_05115 [Candidatus Kapaibacterium sp.]
MIQQLRSLFRANDAIIFTSILIIAIAAGRMPEAKGFSVEYPTALYNTMATIVQSLAPLLAIALGILIYQRGKGGEEEGLMKGIVVLAATLVATLIALPFAHDLHLLSGIGQGVTIGLVLYAIWGVGIVVLGVLTRP